jgi:cysteine desulfurase
VYVDHAATTPLRQEVLEAMLPYLTEQFGNPSSLHGPGRVARRAVDRARRGVAEVLNCAPEEVVFTGSGSEGANLAIKGVVLARPPGQRHIVASKVEHHAVLETCRWLERHAGADLSLVEVDAHGRVDPSDIARAITDRTALVSLMYANNEVGTIEPLREVVDTAHARGVPVHTDAVQAAGALALDVRELGVDLLSLAAHKFYGPKGIGALYVRRGTRLVPQMQGGGQERGRRSGTEAVYAVVGLAEALALAQSEREQTTQRLWPLTCRLLSELPARVPDCRVTGHGHDRLPNHASFAFAGVEIASVLLGLDRQEICASSGSACTSASTDPSHVLVAMGVPHSHLFGALRLTLGRDNTAADVERLLEVIPPLVARARNAAIAA